MTGRLHCWAYWIAVALQLCAAFVLAGVAGMEAVEKTDGGSPVWSTLLGWVQHVSAGWRITAAVAIGPLSGLALWIGPPWVHSAIRRLLTHHSRTVFENLPEPGYDHRITLFVHRRYALMLPRRRKGNRPQAWYWPSAWQGLRSGWLFPYCRSGVAGQSSRTRFWACAKAPPREAEGVAGQTWARRKVVPAEGLPVMSRSATQQDRNEYARRSFLDRDALDAMIESGAKMPRSLLGVPVEKGDGHPWGVIVFDSPDPDAFRDLRPNTTDHILAALHPLVRRTP